MYGCVFSLKWIKRGIFRQRQFLNQLFKLFVSPFEFESEFYGSFNIVIVLSSRSVNLFTLFLGRFNSLLTLILLNILISRTHFWLSANQITSYIVFVPIHKLNDKQCRSAIWSGSTLIAKVGVVVNSRIRVKAVDQYLCAYVCQLLIIALLESAEVGCGGWLQKSVHDHLEIAGILLQRSDYYRTFYHFHSQAFCISTRQVSLLTFKRVLLGWWWW